MPRDNGARASSPGLRHKAAQRPVGKRRRGTKKTIRECWLTGRRGWKHFAEHHVVTKEEDPDLTVWLSRGAHYLVTLLSRYTKVIDDPEKVEDLLMLARTQAGMENKRIVVRYEEVK